VRRVLVVLAMAAAGTASAATLVVANKSEATVSLLDLGSGEVRAVLPTGEGPHEVAVAPDGRTALVANYGTRAAPGGTLTVIDLTLAEVVATVDLAPHRRPHGMAFLSDGRLLVTSEASRALLLVDVARRRVVRALPTGQEISHMVAVAPDGRRAFVANIGSGSVTAVDVATGTAATVPTGEGAEGIAVTPDGAEVWVANRAADTVSVLEAGSLRVLATVEVPSFPIRAAVTPDGERVLVTCARSGDLAVLDRRARRVVRRVELGVRAADPEGRLFGGRFGSSSVPIGIALSGDGSRAWIAHANADIITELDLGSWRVVRRLRAGREPDGMGWSPVAAGPDPAAGR